ncbi:MAG: hypothetical protein WBA28_06090 [Microbacteriaceae bacterium]
MSADNQAVVQDSQYSAPEYVISEDLTTKSKVTTFFGILIGLILAFGGIYMMGQAFEVPEEWGAIMFGGGILVDAMGFWVAFWVIHQIDGQQQKH